MSKRSLQSATLYAALGAVHVAAAAIQNTPIEAATKPLLLPALALYAIAMFRERGARVSRRLLFSLALACAGGVALRSDTPAGLIVGMLFFLAAYAIYTAEFIRSESAQPRWTSRHWLVPIGYGVTVGATMAWLWRGLSARRVAWPVAGYAALMAAMASAATRWGWRVGVGAGLLVASDTLIGIGIAGVAEVPGRAAWVMGTYLLGLALVINGWTSRSRAARTDAVRP